MHCDDCNVACSICSESLASECSECAAGYNWGTAVDYTGTCVEDCATGMFYDYSIVADGYTGSDTCVTCIADCDVCDDTTTCITCN